ncbi:MAG TPA: hypothetical protein VIX82_07590 [Solirubrobacteraceae bacterium]
MTVTRHPPRRSPDVRGYATALLALPVLTACGTSAAASPSPAPSPTHAARCGPASARTLEANPAARVYVAAHGAVYGCAAQTGKVSFLGNRQICFAGPRIGPISLAGRLAAYALQRCGTDTSSSDVVVRDLADGKVLTNRAAISRVPGPESFASVGKIVVKRDGSIAWSAGVSSIGHPSEVFEVHRVDRRGPALLDSGGAIAAASLRLRGSTVTWSDHGQPRSARLD